MHPVVDSIHIIELKICAALYHLHDQFDQWFSKIKGSVDVKNIAKVKKLISEIADGERFVVCGLESVLRELPGLADNIRDQNGAEKDQAIERAKKYIMKSVARLRKTESEIKRTVNAVIALM